MDPTSSGESSFLGASPPRPAAGQEEGTSATPSAVVDPLSPPVSPKQGKSALPQPSQQAEEEGGNAWMFGGGDEMSEMVVRFEINVIKVSLA